MTEFHNQPIPPARVVKLSNRLDGTLDGVRSITFKPGEVLPIAVDGTAYWGPWLDSVDGVTVTETTEGGALQVDDQDVQDGLVLLLIDAAAATDGGVWDVEFDAHPKPTYLTKGKIEVRVESS